MSEGEGQKEVFRLIWLLDKMGLYHKISLYGLLLEECLWVKYFPISFARV